MSVEIKVPVFPESVSEGTLVKWHKVVGEAVSRDEILADIETDKVVFEVPAIDDGVMEEIIEGEGSTVLAGQIIAKIAPGKLPQGSTPAQQDKASQAQVVAIPANDADESLITPSAQKLMAEHGLSKEQVKGSGKDGRVLKEDILKVIENKPATSPTTPAEQTVVSFPSGERPQKRVAMSRLRARIAERLVEAQQTAAILTTFNEVNMQPLMELRKRYRDQFEKTHSVRLGFMSFFVKAAVEASSVFHRLTPQLRVATWFITVFMMSVLPLVLRVVW